MRATARCLIVAVTICAWIAISNHCAIRAVVTKTDMVQSGCPLHSKPPKPEPQHSQCCKILRAISNAPAKTLSPAFVDLAQVDLFGNAPLILASPKISFPPATLNTGPPGKTCFVELNRSMRAHAPPVFA